jgi:UDP-N-acetylglucosamine transferase subunit ALG13
VRVFVSVGTDHHVRQRMVDWVGEWARAHPTVDVFVQHGTASLRDGLHGEKILTSGAMAEQLQAADVVVVTASPGAIMDARRAGRVPIAVPGRKRYDEVVDDHQVRFAELMNAQGLCRSADDREQVFALLDEAVASPEGFRCEPPSGEPAGARRAGQLIDSLVWGR